MSGRLRFSSIRSRLVGAALLGLSLAMALMGIALETAHSTSIDAARIDRQIAELYGLIAEAEAENQALWLPEVLSDPVFNRLDGYRFAGVLDHAGQVVWSSVSMTLIEDDWQRQLKDLPISRLGESESISLALDAKELLGQRMTIRWQTSELQGDYTLSLIHI